MNSYERRIVHEAFKDDPEVGDLESVGFRPDQADHAHPPAREKRSGRPPKDALICSGRMLCWPSPCDCHPEARDGERPRERTMAHGTFSCDRDAMHRRFCEPGSRPSDAARCGNAARDFALRGIRQSPDFLKLPVS